MSKNNQGNISTIAANNSDTLNTYDARIINKQLATVNPLEDNAFKIFLADPKMFAELVNNALNEPMPTDCIVQINGNITFTVKGKEISMDSLWNTEIGIVNIEGQNNPRKFPFKRHLYYWSMIYANSLTKGEDYEDLKPVISIVVYKRKGKSAVMQQANLSGSLIISKDDGKQLNLISLNASKWKKAGNEWLKCFLALVYNGVDLEINKSKFVNIDTDSMEFKEIHRNMRIACGESCMARFEKEDDSVMSTMMRSYLTEEQQQQARNQGIEQGQVLLYYKLGYSIEDIAKEMSISAEKIKVILELPQAQ